MILQNQSFLLEEKPVVLLYNNTIRQKEQERNEKDFANVKVFPLLIRSI